LLKRILLAQHDAFLQADIYTPSIGGMDLVPDPRYMPHDIFVRQVTVEIEGEECWTEARDGFASSVSGIAVDDTGNGVTSGADGVVAKMTTFQAGS
jgi:hypothetical protein